jgi:hypothetical protein
MEMGDVDVVALGERVKSLYGEDVYQVTLQRALTLRTRPNRVLSFPVESPIREGD